ncbi:hypothetical protein F2Q70_00042336 [Brassica cretica]|uniref:Uncharacterized protein n=1 Tax=Brassica cretica TaxID=69181 RepID=A0A8S9KLU9_BRACR|nr:hypothetical protein F2Q70_00042336 [Brassica cretica]
MISAELRVSISTLATSISRIVSSITRRSFRGLAQSIGAPPLERDDVRARGVLHIVPDR